MGCLNSQGQFSHWFGNIHLSGPCNRAYYFCIGQHMPGLDPVNNLDTWPLKAMDEFLAKCREHNVTEINLTGSDTDPLMYRHLPELTAFLREQIPGAVLGIRTNGVLEDRNPAMLDLFDKGSISVTSFNQAIYKKTMGRGYPPDIEGFRERHPKFRVKGNVVLCPETVLRDNKGFSDLDATLEHFAFNGFKKVNIREPYGQTHIGDPLKGTQFEQIGTIYAMPIYNVYGMQVTYWDVHYVEVESVNLYANGNVSVTYPVTLGHDPVLGTVFDQSKFSQGRQYDQWKNKRKLTVL